MDTYFARLIGRVNPNLAPSAAMAHDID